MLLHCGKEDMETDSFVTLGSFCVPTGKLIVSDPCYGNGVWCMGELQNVSCGRWNALAIYRSFLSFGKRVCRLSIKSEKYISFGNLLPEVAPFIVGVDSGIAGFFDSSHFQGGDTKWYDYCRRQTQLPDNAGVITCGVVASAGFGDGEYSCVIYRDRNNLMHMAELIFIADE